MNEWLNNVCLLSDSYKVSHAGFYPPGTEKIYSYFESRVGAKFGKTTFFGLQYFLENYLQGSVVSKEKITEAKEVYKLHFGKNIFEEQKWDYIVEKHNGRLPVAIKAVPEGMEVPTDNVLLTVENTDPNCFWLTNFLETLLVQVWYPCVVATQSREMKRIIAAYLQVTGTPELVDFKLHDFGFRGVTCPEQAALGGAAHLINFKGTDTIPGVLLARKFYNCEMAGYSIPATEHSTITAWGRDHEVDAMRNVLEQYPDGLVACVSDSYDIFRACGEYWGKILKEQVLARNGVLVVRPDSGDPPSTVVKCLEILGEQFGFEKNAKGYKVLNPKVRVIQGDGIDCKMLENILDRMLTKNWSADNIAFGSGGALLQKLNRDTQRSAFKCSSAVVSGVERDVFKQPVTDQSKSSKRGRLKLVRDGENLITVPEQDEREDLLQLVFLDGEMKRHYTFADVMGDTSLSGS